MIICCFLHENTFNITEITKLTFNWLAGGHFIPTTLFWMVMLFSFLTIPLPHTSCLITPCISTWSSSSADWFQLVPPRNFFLNNVNYNLSVFWIFELSDKKEWLKEENRKSSICQSQSFLLNFLCLHFSDPRHPSDRQEHCARDHQGLSSYRPRDEYFTLISGRESCRTPSCPVPHHFLSEHRLPMLMTSLPPSTRSC